ncbi:MAG: sulfite exporter TauE/SafE family protein [Candidatus Thorarchaeota archaeon]|nr:sulfite exporter TauE/SafE family protein [Candidatus Thorarchaeota archaeon]
MQELIADALMIAIFAVGVGTLSSMLGIGGGIINTPLLIIAFGLESIFARASALVAAMFVAISSSWAYYRQNPQPTVYKAGFFLAITTIPGSWVGGWLAATVFTTYGDEGLRWVFAVLLFPIALKMLFAKKKGKSDLVSELSKFDFSKITKRTLTYALIGAFVGGIVANLLGLGGGVIIVPVLGMIMGLPMHAAVATSMFTMVFTTAAGTAQNVFTGTIDIYYSLALGVGMVIGAQIGPKLACRVNAVQLKQIFGLVLVYPLVRMVRAGQLVFDPTGTDFVAATLGDVIIWLVIVVPIGILRVYQKRNQPKEVQASESCDTPAQS